MSATRCMGARLLCASPTIFMIWASSVSPPTLSASIKSVPVVFTAAPMTLSPGFFSTGIDSPVIMDSSTKLLPSTTLASTGIFSPGLTLKRSPGLTISSGTSSSEPFCPTILAVFGDNPRSALIAPLAPLRALSSSTCPRRTKVVITPAASKYTGTCPVSVLNDGGKIPGNSVATML